VNAPADDPWMMTALHRVLVTGAAGGVGRLLLPGLANPGQVGRLRLTDLREIPDPPPGAEVSYGDLTDPDFAAAVTADVDAVVHLAANPDPGAGWPHLRGPNVDAVATLLAAARAAGVARVALASSAHAAGGYFRPDALPIDPAWPAHPCCGYGATKVFAEALGRVYADTGELSVVCLRLGATLPEPQSASVLPGWLSPADLRRLVCCGLTAEVRYGVYFGCSANTRLAFDIGSARQELGYEPVDDSEAFAARFATEPPAPMSLHD
jgi:nucleoside-diphosphate-sugar epimerase